ncbi:unnamed protein product [Adineta steineri]|uniref:LTD domain-containing protein n=1 Tax=Adineta steineri TaxID=433720 RepID=A0A818I2P9_9BILA|nr:unnamed protein product [Adineta steineri]
MEKLLHLYLRILDIDPFGYFIRLINISYKQSLDLSNICIQQIDDNIQIRNSYTFHDQIRTLLHHGEIATIYSKDYKQLKFDIEPHIFIAKDVSKWFSDDHITIEISINNIVFDSRMICSLTTNDIPLLYIKQSNDFKPLSINTISNTKQYERFIFPYCLSIDNNVNPHNRGISKRNENKFKRNICYEEKQIVKHFDLYARRLTTAPKIIQSLKKK